MTFLGRKLVVVLLSVAAGIVLLAAGRADWVTGTVDGVAGPVRTAAVGTEAAPGLAGIALVAMAAAIAATTSGRIARWICLGVLGLVAAGVVALSVRCVVAAPDVLGSVAATHSGGTGTLEATGSATVWPWVAMVAAGLLLVALVGGISGGRRWGGLGSKYERPGAETEAHSVSGARGERVDSDWDRVTLGDDPSVD
ncbi:MULTISPECIES: Trp biosynthesis-associated membrane protein [Janibacter]|uniref:Trp biosynthesis-associated membrane protein n=1 Tax=Janibacter TaxID=53457 RepID=UPI0021A3DE04|nr:Trp biosynthesis-associated membrane protein [Janibacter hoylei]MCT1617761.1 Trp biosynthesis-associated membrane protein [Janibacter hoylei]MCT2292430.1 Trp biosynthesis-associated membrane protein [Janibacter hoylei]